MSVRIASLLVEKWNLDRASNIATSALGALNSTKTKPSVEPFFPFAVIFAFLAKLNT